MSTQQSTIVTSEQGKINWRDVGRGLLITVISAFIGSLSQGLETWFQTDTFAIDTVMLVRSVKFAISAGLSYIVLNVFSASKVLLINPPKNVIDQVETKATVEVAGEIMATKNAPKTTV